MPKKKTKKTGKKKKKTGNKKTSPKSKKTEKKPKKKTGKKSQKKKTVKKTKKSRPKKKTKKTEKKTKRTKKKKDSVFTTGKRKRAVARAIFKKGKGRILINNRPLDTYSNEMATLTIREPLILTGDKWKKYDIRINASGGGFMGQAEASRMAIARGLVKIFGDQLKERFLNYDRNLLVYDPRRKETRKPPRSKQGARRHKQRSKR